MASSSTERSFYPQGGGQVGDTGVLLRAGGERIPVVDTRKGDAPDSVLHVLAPDAPRPEVGETLVLEIDWERRYALMRLHTALHVMSCVVVAPVTGGNIAPERARLDFDIDMSLLDAKKIEQEVNALIARGIGHGNGVDHRRGARRAAGARQDHERTAPAWRGAGAAPQHTRHRSAAVRRDARRQHRRDRQYPRAEIRSEGKRNKRVEIGLA
jgi:misacylated tRNA(Ala) deacylase